MSAGALDPRTPVIVGAGQLTHHDGDAPEPVVLLAEAARRAGDDAGGRVLRAVDSVRVVRIVSRSYPDPGRLVAEALGLEGVETVYCGGGGQLPQILLAGAADEIRRGVVDVVLLGGAESWRTRRAIKRRGDDSGWRTQDARVRPDRTIGPELRMTNADESAIGFVDPVHAYPLFESALRARRGSPPADHLAGVAAQWARFGAVAAANPHAVLRHAPTADEIATVSPQNRLICSPYRKLMVANDDVDQAAALLLCSVERARSLGVPSDRWVFLHGHGEAEDTPFVSNRADLSRSAAIRAAGAHAFELAGVGPDDIAHVDLYSCFPSAVQIAADELGFAADRELTVTGGLTFAGGPWHDYVTHSISTMVGLLRNEPDAFGLCSANGGLLTKHAVGIFSCRPPERPWTVPMSPFVPASRRSVPDHDGPATVEASTVVHDRNGSPVTGFAACVTDEGARVLAAVAPASLAAFAADDRGGERVDIGGGQVR